MPRTYPDRETYDAACGRLAAHLATLTADQVSLVYADGGTTDTAGQTWIPAGSHLVDGAAWNTWFIEEHGAAARWSGGQWHPAEPGDGELTDSALALWGEDDADFGYPLPNAWEADTPDLRVPMWCYAVEESDDRLLPRADPRKPWQQVHDGYDNASADAMECARAVMDAYLENHAGGPPVTWDVRVMVWGQGHDHETAETADAVVYAPER